MVAVFVEERLELGIDYGAIGGPRFQTSIVATFGGWEQRNIDWAASKGEWEAGDRIVTKSELKTIQDFFQRRRGAAVGFRWKDWSDFESLVTRIALGDGTIGPFQIKKTYGAVDAELYQRNIFKLVDKFSPAEAIAVTISDGFRNLPILDGDLNDPEYTVGLTDGLITFAANKTDVITTISQATSAVITGTTNPGFGVGDQINISGVAGMTEINGRRGVISSIGAGPPTYTVDIDSSAFTAYSSGGVVNTLPQTGETILGTFEFDVPVRFGVDEIQVEFNAHEPDSGESLYSISQLPIIEIFIEGI